jgi:hypothetical protein
VPWQGEARSLRVPLARCTAAVVERSRPCCSQTYAPDVFRLLRDMHGVRNYSEALHGDWIPFSTNSKSGQLFFFNASGGYLPA